MSDGITSKTGTPPRVGEQIKGGSPLKPQARLSALSNQPLRFIENRGQFDSKVKFQVSGHGPTLWLTNQGVVFDALRAKERACKPGDVEPNSERQLRQHFLLRPDPKGAAPDPQSVERLVFSEDFIGANADPEIETSGREPGIYNYFFGKDPKKWVTHVAAYSEVIYRDLWPGIDLRLYRNGTDIEQEFAVKPGADLTKVQVAYKGIDGLVVAKDGTLVIKTAFGELRESKPRIYQEIAGQRVKVEGRFKLTNEFAYTFEVAPHKSQYALVLDPTLVYSTYLGGNYASGYGITADSSGNAYVTGEAPGTDFPTTPGAFQTSVVAGGAFVTKLNPSGSALVYSTYLGGTGINGNTEYSQLGSGIAADSSGNAYVVGTSQTADFPTTPGAFQTSLAGGQNAFVTKLNPSGSALVYSTYLGGTYAEDGSSIAVDPSGNAYVTGWTGSSDFPTTPGAFQTSLAGGAFVTKLNPSGSALVYSGILPGGASGIALDSLGNAYVTGTAGNNLPTTPGAFQTSFTGVEDAWVTKLNPSGTALVYCTYLSGGYDFGNGIAVDSSGNAYVIGYTYSPTFPTTPGAFQILLTASPNWPNTFVSELNPSGSALAYSTYLGGGNEIGSGIALDSIGNVYVTGYTASSSFPVTPNAIQATLGGGYDAFLSQLYPAGKGVADLLYSSYLGGGGDDLGYGIAVDPGGNVYLTGDTSSPDFPVTQGAFQSSNSGGSPFVAKFAFASQSPSILWMTSNVGGNAGTTTPTIVGSGFQPGATVQLNCPGLPSIVGTNTIVSPNGSSITATFNLVGATPEACNVVVTNPSGATVSQQDAFTIEQGGAPDVWVDVVGFDKLRAGEPQQYYIVYGNRGNVDTKIGVGLWVSFPSFITCTTAQNEPIGGSLQLGSNTVLFLQFASPFSAGQIFTIPITLTAPDTPQYAHFPFQIQTWFGPP
jgi:hypothetical protein